MNQNRPQASNGDGTVLDMGGDSGTSASARAGSQEEIGVTANAEGAVAVNSGRSQLAQNTMEVSPGMDTAGAGAASSSAVIAAAPGGDKAEKAGVGGAN